MGFRSFSHFHILLPLKGNMEAPEKHKDVTVNSNTWVQRVKKIAEGVWTWPKFFLLCSLLESFNCFRFWDSFSSSVAEMITLTVVMPPMLGVDAPLEMQNDLERFWEQKKKQAEPEAGSSNWPLGNGAILFSPFYSLLLPFYSTFMPSFPGGLDRKRLPAMWEIWVPTLG